jgi:hypothetical protein
MLKIFLDTEFTALTQHAQLISLALKAETGQEFYAEFTDVDLSELNDWLQENVVQHLFLKESNREAISNMQILDDSIAVKQAIEIWLQQFGATENSIQFWGDCPAWDWILFCELWGGSFSRPKQVHYMCMDLATYLVGKGYAPDVERHNLVKNYSDAQNLQPHNALYDARLEMEILKVLEQL